MNPRCGITSDHGVSRSPTRLSTYCGRVVPHTSFPGGGSGTDVLYVRAFDGQNWSVEAARGRLFMHRPGESSTGRLAADVTRPRPRHLGSSLLFVTRRPTETRSPNINSGMDPVRDTSRSTGKPMRQPYYRRTCGPFVSDQFQRGRHRRSLRSRLRRHDWSVESFSWTTYSCRRPGESSAVVSVADISATAVQVICCLIAIFRDRCDGDRSQNIILGRTTGTIHFTLNGVIPGHHQIIDVPLPKWSQTSSR